MSTIIGKIASMDGTFYVKGSDGSLREVSEGYEVLKGETIVGDKGNNPSATVVISMSDGSELILPSQDKQLFDSSLSSEEFALEETVTQNDSIQNILQEYGDIDNAQELETAAGEGAGVESTEGGEAVFAKASNASTDINAALNPESFTSEEPENNNLSFEEEARRVEINNDASVITDTNENPVAVDDTITKVQNNIIDVSQNHASINVGNEDMGFTNAFTISQTITSTGN
ncbi:MAG: cell shape-determining protein MreD, partial [Sulfurimonas sp.]|nr:cell shape-determining protein MreD [Sulfurimonas sp.]MCW8954607.1 cell shape-determining protein MreD [Sulfurimonas sp.]